VTNTLRRPLVAGNWKMYNTVAESVALARAIADNARIGPRTDVVLCPTFISLAAVSQALQGTRVTLGAQDVHWEVQGAHTGEISAVMLKDVGCRYCIVGHSERRQYLGETDEMMTKKLIALQRQGIIPIACLGETLAERESGRTFDVVQKQLDAFLYTLDESGVRNLVVAYEPVWAIGTGRTAKSSDAQQVHAYIRERIRHRHADAADATRIIYGGSVKADNAAELLAQPDIDGALVGGASLDAESFARIIQSAG
jgi:triosephosphate isomerase (TIM)